MKPPFPTRDSVALSGDGESISGLDHQKRSDGYSEGRGAKTYTDAIRPLLPGGPCWTMRGTGDGKPGQ